MPIYIILPTKNGKALAESAKAAGIDILEEYFPEGGFLASFPGIAPELAKKIGMDGEGKIGTGIIQPMDGYHGFASKLIWEWINTRKAAEHGQ
jgi:hypothetical protein